jgi:DNA (cytosine-5)-methyltransferase 1
MPDHPFLEADIREVTPAVIRAHSGGSAPTVIAGGPPCQGFSSAGARLESDERNSLVGYYSNLAVEVRPEVIVFENVEGFLTAGGGRFVTELLDPLIAGGYSVRVEKLNVANSGVPQLRKRVIAIAALGRVPVAIEPTHRADGAPGVWRVGRHLPRTQTLAEALEGMRPGPGDSLNVKKFPNGREMARMKALEPGQIMRDLDPSLQHSSYARRANRRVSDGTPTERRGGAPVGLRRLRGDEPSKAITSAATREFVHPTEDRPLTLREAAHIQTFPDNFDFLGTQQQIATMIGNAIPPRFATALGRALLQTLAGPRGADHPAVVDFNVTRAEAMSPALARVMREVEHRYPWSGERQAALF